MPTRYNMVDDVLTLEVDHQNSGVNYAYPILADPCWKFLSEGCKKKVAKDAMGGLITARTSVLVAIAATAVSGGDSRTCYAQLRSRSHNDRHGWRRRVVHCDLRS